MSANDSTVQLCNDILDDLETYELKDFDALHECMDNKFIYEDDIFDILKTLADPYHINGSQTLYEIAYDLLENMILDDYSEELERINFTFE